MIRYILTSTAVFLTLLSVSVMAKELGTFGAVYPIAERDALEELEARAKQVNWQKVMDRRKVRDYTPPNMQSLPQALKNRVFIVDMTYRLGNDIPDGKGGILYPRGYSFNPLDYVPFRKTLVVINGSDKRQVKWFKESQYARRMDVMLLLSHGSFSEIGKELKRPVFYADKRIIGKFQLKAVPSVVFQNGRMMEVKEIAIKNSR